MQRLLDVVLKNYRRNRQARSVITSDQSLMTPDEEAILQDIPTAFNTALNQLRPKCLNYYTVEGSCGAGNKSLCPWVAIFRNDITTSAEEGYYIVLLFAEDMSKCVLSLNQGYTTYEERYLSTALASKLIRETADEVVRHITLPAGALTGPISLGATRGLGKGYEQGAIASFEYPASGQLTMAQFTADLSGLLDSYDYLANIVGAQLEAFTPNVTDDFNEAVEEHILANKKVPLPLEAPGKETPPPLSRATAGGRYPRNPKKAEAAIRQAQYKCEVDPGHTSFLSKKTKENYVEAHHLIPLRHQGKKEYAATSLDVRANIVALCPTCHRLLHHGEPSAKAPLLAALFSSTRRAALKAKELKITLNKLNDLYTARFDETD